MHILLGNASTLLVVVEFSTDSRGYKQCRRELLLVLVVTEHGAGKKPCNLSH